jgi:hypothetical protein
MKTAMYFINEIIDIIELSGTVYHKYAVFEQLLYEEFHDYPF